ncbi:MAG: collagen binding domain-containing protein [Collinsella sp.]
MPYPHLQIVKRDAQTGGTVPLAGFTFQLLDSHHEPISQTCWYPAHNVMNTFTTDTAGAVTLPESLNPGTYYVHEASAKNRICAEKTWR